MLKSMRRWIYVMSFKELQVGPSFSDTYLSSFKASEIKLKNMYCTILQSVLEYSSVVYGPMLTKYEINRLENIQEMLEIHTYLITKKLETLKERRRKERLSLQSKRHLTHPKHP